jgi:chemotaxis protein MotA
MNIPIGWLIALSCALFGYMWLGGHLAQLWVPQEYLVIFGATLGTLIAGNKFRNLKNLIQGIWGLFFNRGQSKKDNLALLCLMFELLQKIKRHGVLSLESDIESPQTSTLFAKYPAVLKKSRLLEFLTDYFRMMLDGTVTLSQLDTVMSQEIDVMHQEALEPSQSMSNLADSLPAFGIVSAIIGVIHTLSTISAGKSPGEIGANIASALVGTLLGVFSAYAIFSPIARTLDQKAEEDLRPFEAIKEILIANYSHFSPVIAVEYGRKVLYSDQRPSMVELEAGVLSATGNSMRD